MGEPTPLAEGLWCLPLATGTRSPVATPCYLIAGDDGSVHVVDPGVSATSSEQWRYALASWGIPIERIASVTATHMHPDHLGGVAALARESGAVVQLAEREVKAMDAAATRESDDLVDTIRSWGAPDGVLDDFTYIAARAPRPERPVVDVLLRDGDLLDIPGRTLRVMATPGHTPGHICLDLPDEGRVVVGDLILPTTFPGIGLGGDADHGALRDYHRSLDALDALGDREVLPGHGYCFSGLSQRVDETRRHHRRRTQEVRRALENGASSTWDVAVHLTWTAGFANLRGFFLFSALQQTAMHIDHVRGGIE